MRLIDLEGDTNFTIQNRSAVKGQKLGLCHPRRPRGSESGRRKRRDKLCLKTFVAPFLPARLTAPGSPRMGLCLPSLIFLSPRLVSPFLSWGGFHARSRFVRSTVPRKNGGLLYSTANDPQPQMIPRLQMIPKMDRK